MRRQNNNTTSSTRQLTKISTSLKKAIQRIKSGKADGPKAKIVVANPKPKVVRRERDEIIIRQRQGKPSPRMQTFSSLQQKLKHVSSYDFTQENDPTITQLPCTNAINVQTTSANIKLGTILSSAQPIHPSNHRLFPNLAGIWRSFNQYSLGHTHVDSQPLSSSLISGAYLFALIPSTQDEDSNMLPIFSSLINYATAKVATIFRPMVYKFAGDILHRLGSYLMQSADQSTSSPGTLYVSTSQGSASNESFIMPIMTLKSKMHLKDFVPANAQPTPEDLGLAILFGATDPPMNGNVFSSSSVYYSTGGYGLTVNTAQGSTNWFKLTQGGHYTLTITVGYTSDSWVPYQLTVDGEQVKYVSGHKGKAGCQYTYMFDAQAGSQIGSPVAPGWVTSNPVINQFFSFFVTHKLPSLAATMTRIKHHATGRLNGYKTHIHHVNSPQNSTLLLRRNKTIYETSRAQQDCDVSDDPTVVVQCLPEEGFCWLKSLASLKVLKATNSIDTVSITNVLNSAVAVLPYTPFISTNAYVDAINALGVAEQMIQRFKISFISSTICHISQRQNCDPVQIKLLHILKLYDLVGWTPSWCKLLSLNGIEFKQRVCRSITVLEQNQYNPRMMIQIPSGPRRFYDLQINLTDLFHLIKHFAINVDYFEYVLDDFNNTALLLAPGSSGDPLKFIPENAIFI